MWPKILRTLYQLMLLPGHNGCQSNHIWPKELYIFSREPKTVSTFTVVQTGHYLLIYNGWNCVAEVTRRYQSCETLHYFVIGWKMPISEERQPIIGLAVCGLFGPVDREIGKRDEIIFFSLLLSKMASIFTLLVPHSPKRFAITLIYSCYYYKMLGVINTHVM